MSGKSWTCRDCGQVNSLEDKHPFEECWDRMKAQRDEAWETLQLLSKREEETERERDEAREVACQLHRWAYQHFNGDEGGWLDRLATENEWLRQVSKS